MNRSIEIRLRRLEAVSTVAQQPRRAHRICARSDREGDATIANLIAAGAADPDDLFIVRVLVNPSVMHDNYR
jgi:hypothetical protein